MENSTWSILGLIVLIIIFLVSFPENTKKIIENKFYLLLIGVAFLLIVFFIYLKLKKN